MRRRHTFILLVAAVLVAACTSPTSPAPTSHDEQITIGPHPDVAAAVEVLPGR